MKLIILISLMILVSISISGCLFSNDTTMTREYIVNGINKNNLPIDSIVFHKTIDNITSTYIYKIDSLKGDNNEFSISHTLEESDSLITIFYEVYSYKIPIVSKRSVFNFNDDIVTSIEESDTILVDIAKDIHLNTPRGINLIPLYGNRTEVELLDSIFLYYISISDSETVSNISDVYSEIKTEVYVLIASDGNDLIQPTTLKIIKDFDYIINVVIQPKEGCKFNGWATINCDMLPVYEINTIRFTCHDNGIITAQFKEILLTD